MRSGRMPLSVGGKVEACADRGVVNRCDLSRWPALTGRRSHRMTTLSRGHLSRPACSHVKQIAKRPGTREPGPRIFPGRVFCWPRRPRNVRVKKRQVRVAKYRPETRLVQSGILRSQFGETSEALFLTQGYVYDSCRAGRGPLQGRGSRLSVFALRQSDRRRCSSSAWPSSRAPKRRARPRPAWPR